MLVVLVCFFFFFLTNQLVSVLVILHIVVLLQELCWLGQATTRPSTVFKRHLNADPCSHRHTGPH